MDTTKFNDKGSIKMVAHRGVSGLEKENTCPAFELAGKKSYYGIETDVHVTKDGKFILAHDSDLRRLADVDMMVEESNFDDLRALRMKGIDGGKVRDDLFLPTLEEYIGICKKYDKQAVLELKNSIFREKVWEIADITKELGWIDRVTFIAFSRQDLLYLRERYPEADAQLLIGYCTEDDIKFMVDNRFDTDLYNECLTKEKVKRLHEAGIKVNVWTVNTLEEAKKMQDFGVDMITTNILE